MFEDMAKIRMSDVIDSLRDLAHDELAVAARPRPKNDISDEDTYCTQTRKHRLLRQFAILLGTSK